jgi:tRNA(Met) C34 N-acetyltransferase TmcA
MQRSLLFLLAVHYALDPLHAIANWPARRDMNVRTDLCRTTDITRRQSWLFRDLVPAPCFLLLSTPILGKAHYSSAPSSLARLQNLADHSFRQATLPQRPFSPNVGALNTGQEEWRLALGVA